MSIRKTIITTVVALTMVAMVAPGVAQGVTIDELLAQIAQLQAQLLALQGSATPTGLAPAACSGITLTRTLVKGSTGSDVKCVQALLNTNAATQVAASGVGSAGNETTTYGNLTVAAVKKFQAMYGTGSLGTVGPLTRAKMNSMLSGGTTGGGTTVVPTGTGLTVALASNNPASSTIVDGQALASLAKLVFLNGDNTEVKVTVLKLKRIGISADASIANLYLFDGATRLTDGAAVSSTVINFNNTSGLFTVPAGGSKIISLLADISAANAAAGETMGLQVVVSTDVSTNASSVNGTFPITGNLHTVATGTLAGVEFNATTTPSDATIDPQNDYTVWQNSVIITTRSVDMTRISFRKTGSVKDADLQNFRLYVDGVQVGSAVPNLVLSSNNESLVTFDLAVSPKRLEAGTRVVKLMADIIGGSSLTFQFHLWNVADSTFVDTQYGANITPDLVSDASFTKRSAGTSGMTVGSGTITFTKKTDSPSGNIVDGASNATLAKFEVKAAGEKVKIENLYISANVDTSGVSGLRNGMLLANGVQIGSTTTLYDPADSSYDYTTFSLGSSLLVVPGIPVTLEVSAYIYDTGTSDTT
ncbi:MAG: peptidoglycan-binding protein, partial [Patescibacteria group bacterium]